MLKNLLRFHAVVPELVHDPIVKVQKCQMQLRDEHMRVIARIADQGEPLGVAGQVADGTVTRANQELVGIVHVVQVWLADRTGAVDTFQIEPGRTEVLENGYVLGFLQRGTIVGDVMGDELSEKRPARGDPWIVLSQPRVDIRPRFQWTAGGSILEQIVAARLLAGQLRKKPSEAALGQVG